VAAGAWRVAHGSRFACAVPQDRVAAVWPAGDAHDSRRQSIQRAFAATGRASAATSWERLAKVLDDHLGAWRAMYVQACEATHVRGEQSAEVLDLRMSCLNDNLDQVRALTDKLAAADPAALSHAVAAAQDLTPASRCADVTLLRSAVPLPRDERTLREVQRLRRRLPELQTLIDIGDFAELAKRATALRGEVEATGYKPLLGELLFFIGAAQANVDPDPSNSEASMKQAMLIAEASRDDLAAAKIAASLVYVVGYRLGRLKEAEFWAGLGHAILDRVGGDQSRLRGWLDGNLAGVFTRAGDWEGARVRVERAVRLKAQGLGNEHPDVAASYSDMAYVLTRGGHIAEAIAAANRAVEIFLRNSDPDAYALGMAYTNQGEALNASGKHEEAEVAFRAALENMTRNAGRIHPETAFALHGLGETRLFRGAPLDAVPLFEDALRARQQPAGDPVLAAESQFGLARALWQSGGDRKKARVLATAALQKYREERRPQQREVEAWLADHRAAN